MFLIKFPRFIQPTATSCTPACVKMLLEYYSKPMPFRHVAEGCNFTEGFGSYAEHAAEFLALLGLRPILFSFDPYLHPPWYRHAGSRAIKKDLKRRLGQGSPDLRSRRRALFSFMNNGGVFRATTLSLGDLKKILRSGRPILISIESNHLFYTGRRKIAPTSHTVVAVGYKGDQIIFRDPTRDPLQRKNELDFLDAWYSDHGEALYIQ